MVSDACFEKKRNILLSENDIKHDDGGTVLSPPQIFSFDRTKINQILTGKYRTDLYVNTPFCVLFSVDTCIIIVSKKVNELEIDQ